jgi:hypothetical protein
MNAWHDPGERFAQARMRNGDAPPPEQVKNRNRTKKARNASVAPGRRNG